MTAETPPSLADENRPRHPGRWQGLVVGLLAAAGLAACVAAAAVFFGGQGEDDDPDDLSRDQPRQASLDGGWTGPPADATEADLIPQALGRWDLVAADANPGNAMLGIDLDGFHGTYQTVGRPDTVDLAIYRADDAAAGGAMDAVRARTDDPERFAGVRLSEDRLPGTDRTLRFDVPAGDGVPELHGVVAAAGGWLMMARSDTEDALAPFLATYMQTVESDGAAEPPSGAPAPGGSRGLPDPPPGGGLGGAAATE